MAGNLTCKFVSYHERQELLWAADGPALWMWHRNAIRKPVKCGLRTRSIFPCDDRMRLQLSPGISKSNSVRREWNKHDACSKLPINCISLPISRDSLRFFFSQQTQLFAKVSVTNIFSCENSEEKILARFHARLYPKWRETKAVGSASIFIAVCPLRETRWTSPRPDWPVTRRLWTPLIGMQLNTYVWSRL